MDDEMLETIEEKIREVVEDVLRYRVICRGFESDGLQIIHILKHNKAS